MLRSSLLALLLFCAAARGQCDIAPANRVFNRTGSQCVWASLETQARHWGYWWLYDLTTVHRGTSGPSEVCRVLSARGTLYCWQPMGPHDYANLRNAMACHWPTAVGMNRDHMLTLVDITQTTVKVIDNGGPKALKVQEWSIGYFDANWDGWAVTLVGR